MSDQLSPDTENAVVADEAADRADNQDSADPDSETPDSTKQKPAEKKPLGEGTHCKTFERRDRRRFPFLKVQLVAPRFGQIAPADSDFEPVRCRDLSSIGFSYWSAYRPDQPEVMVKFRSKDETLCIQARVAHVTNVDSESAPEKYLVGCVFVGRTDRANDKDSTADEDS